MTQRLALRIAAALASGTSAVGALAHDGHGLAGAHWHATDVAIFIAAIAAAAVALWLGRK
jgi:hypothetical protein